MVAMRASLLLRRYAPHNDGTIGLISFPGQISPVGVINILFLRAMSYILTTVFIFIILPVLIGWLLYFIPIKLGYKKTGRILLIGYVSVILMVVVYSSLQDHFFSEADAREILAEQEIVFADRVKVEDNKTCSVLDDYCHTFRLTISDGDKNRIIQSLENTPYLSNDDSTYQSFRAINMHTLSGPAQQRYYQDEYHYIMEYFKPNGNYAPTYRTVRISKTENLLEFEEY